MKTVTLNIYKFEELSPEIQSKVIEKNRDLNVDYDWWAPEYEDAENIGLKITGFGLDRNRHAEGDFILSAQEVAANIFRDHGESCSTYEAAKEFMEKWEPVFSDYLDENSDNYESGNLEDEMIELENEFRENLLECYSIILQNKYEHLLEDECVIETIEARDYLFYEDGKRYFELCFDEGHPELKKFMEMPVPKNWNDLIPVLKKIDDVEIPEDNNLRGDITHALLDYDLEATYQAAINFVKFFNQNK